MVKWILLLVAKESFLNATSFFPDEKVSLQEIWKVPTDTFMYVQIKERFVSKHVSNLWPAIVLYGLCRIIL